MTKDVTVARGRLRAECYSVVVIIYGHKLSASNVPYRNVSEASMATEGSEQN